MSQIRKIRWLLEHEPVELFLRTARAFDERIRKLTNDQIQVEIYTKEQYQEKFGTTSVTTDPLLLMTNGDIEMTQTQIVNVAQWSCHDFFALEMPYLFRDHDHATRVLDGDIGQGLLDSVQKNTPSKGLAFTYSGGYRVIASKDPIRVLADMQGLTCLTDVSSVRTDTAKAFGLKVVPYKIARDEIKSIETKIGMYENNRARETTLPRYEAEAYHAGHHYIGATNHSMFLTTILVNKNFYDSLTLDQQSAMEKVSKEVAKIEREWSIQDAEALARNTVKHEQLGIEYHEFSKEEINKLKKATEPLYTKYKDVFSPSLLDDIMKS